MPAVFSLVDFGQGPFRGKAEKPRSTDDVKLNASWGLSLVAFCAQTNCTNQPKREENTLKRCRRHSDSFEEVDPNTESNNTHKTKPLGWVMIGLTWGVNKT